MRGSPPAAATGPQRDRRPSEGRSSGASLSPPLAARRLRAARGGGSVSALPVTMWSARSPVSARRASAAVLLLLLAAPLVHPAPPSALAHRARRQLQDDDALQPLQVCTHACGGTRYNLTTTGEASP